MTLDHQYNPYASIRKSTYGYKGMVATSQPLAAQIGLDILKQGGNAIDAAVAAAGALTVLEPCSNGIGGDAFAVIWHKGKLHGLNASGPAPHSISGEAVSARGYTQMPNFGPLPVTVPGAPAAWAALSERFGQLSLSQVLAPAIHYAEEGFAVTPTIAQLWQRAHAQFSKQLQGDMYEPWFATFATEGRAPYAGEKWRLPDHARTLRLIGDTNGEAFYRGELAEKIADFLQSIGGFLTLEDLQAYHPHAVTPIRTAYRGYDIWEIPPNGQGLIALMALQMLEGYTDWPSVPTTEAMHRQIEAMKLAFADGAAHLTDAEHMRYTVEQLLDPAYGESRRRQIGSLAAEPVAGVPASGGTVYLATADEEGNMVSFIQSNYRGFGSGLVVPGTGIALQNRGHHFSLDPMHINYLEPGKRTYHTIIPGFVTKNGTPIGPFGVMGAMMQPQGHVQVMMNMIDYGLHPQAALDAPRWQWLSGKRISVEPGFPQHEAHALARRGHQVEADLHNLSFGRGQIIWRDPDSGLYIGGSDTRTDGLVAAW